ncbi:MAG: ATP-binding protein [Spirochaetaceae bacterium]|nr:ATP-binding protein [Spirochaetaceae bacterium]
MHASLSDIIFDLVQNSIEAGAENIEVSYRETGDELGFTVNDNGKGMDSETLKRAEDPFWSDGIKHPERRFGLGLPFLRQTAEQTGGRVDIDSVPGKGTKVEAVFPSSHLDLPPAGCLELLWMQCLTFGSANQLIIHRSGLGADGKTDSYRIDKAEISEALGGLSDINGLGLLREYLESLEEPFKGDV